MIVFEITSLYSTSAIIYDLSKYQLISQESVSKLAKYTIIYQIIIYGLQDNIFYLELTEKKCKSLRNQITKNIIQVFYL